MKRTYWTTGVLLLSLGLSSAVLMLGTAHEGKASSAEIPNTFTAGTTAFAAEVNANFTAVKAAIDDNDSRITTNEADIASKLDRTDDRIPIAYGTVINGTLSNASSNVASVTYSGASERYEIDFTDFSYLSTTYTTSATPVSFTRPVIITIDSLSGILAVYLWDVSGNATTGNFSFVIWQ